MSIKKEQQIYAEIGSIIENFCLNNGFVAWVNNNNLLQWGQPTMQGLPNPCILMNYFDGRKVGWVSTKYKWNKEAQKGKAEVSNYRKIIMTLTFFRDPKFLVEVSKNWGKEQEVGNYAIDSNGNLNLLNPDNNTFSDVWLSNEENSTLNIEKNSSKVGDSSVLNQQYDAMAEDVANALRMYFLSDIGVSALHKLGYSILDTSLIRNPIIEMDDEKYARTPNFDITLTTFESIDVDADFITHQQQKEDFSQNKTFGKSQIIGV